MRATSLRSLAGRVGRLTGCRSDGKKAKVTDWNGSPAFPDGIVEGAGRFITGRDERGGGRDLVGRVEEIRTGSVQIMLTPGELALRDV